MPAMKYAIMDHDSRLCGALAVRALDRFRRDASQLLQSSEMEVQHLRMGDGGMVVAKFTFPFRGEVATLVELLQYPVSTDTMVKELQGFCDMEGARPIAPSMQTLALVQMDRPVKAPGRGYDPHRWRLVVTTTYLPFNGIHSSAQ